MELDQKRSMWSCGGLAALSERDEMCCSPSFRLDHGERGSEFHSLSLNQSNVLVLLRQARPYQVHSL